MACSNCNTDFDSTKEGLVLTQTGRAVTSICEACLTGARLVKLVVRRGDIGNFAYEQFSIIETIGGMSSKRAG